MTTTSANWSAALALVEYAAQYAADKAAAIFNREGCRMDELAVIGEHYTAPIKITPLGLPSDSPFAIVLSLPQRSRENEPLRQVVWIAEATLRYKPRG